MIIKKVHPLKGGYLAAIVLFVLFLTASVFGQQIDRKCATETDCLALNIEDGAVVGDLTGDFSGKLTIGNFESRGRPFVPATEAPISFCKTTRGWVGVVAAYVPEQFLLWPELRLYIYNPKGEKVTVQDLYNRIGKNPPNFHCGNLFNTGTELLQVSTDGEHAYVVRTLVWLLPETTLDPILLLDLKGLVERIQQRSATNPDGLWIEMEGYDGVDAATKSKKSDFWIWDEGRKTFTRREPTTKP